MITPVGGPWLAGRGGGLGRRPAGRARPGAHRRAGAAARAHLGDGAPGADRGGAGVVQGEHAGAAPRGDRRGAGLGRVPDRVPPLLASDLERGWMLMADAGDRLREVVAEERSLARWHDVLDGCADLHGRSSPTSTSWSPRASPTCGWPTLADAYAELVQRLDVEPRFRDAVGRVRDLVDELASYGVAGDAPARRPARRPGLREGRPQPDPRLGRRGGLAPVLHDVGDAGGRRRVGARRRRPTPRTSGRTSTPTWRATRPTGPSCATPYRRRCGWAGCAGRSTTPRSAARSTRTRGCGCSSTAGRNSTSERLYMSIR